MLIWLTWGRFGAGRSDWLQIGRPFTLCSPDNHCQEDNFRKQRIQNFDDLPPAPGRAEEPLVLTGGRTRVCGGAGLWLPGVMAWADGQF